ncbi:hypothetical protein BJY01DRAFT_81048 [Aspergillus pseudoustus]|uniref:Zn(2)-C6 fungal-type domain-containing protein n=1 Tax=Aspergillus pseudoustus TaxID=1810923 RepID=A0ABR4J401_9EURO
MSGRRVPRSRNGCSSCRMRKLKCDEQRPVCSRCLRSQLSCDWEWYPISRPAATGHPDRARPRSLRPKSPTQSGFLAALARSDDEEEWASGLELRSRSRSGSGQRIPTSATPLVGCRVQPCSILCSNSIELSPLDRECFMFFPHGLQPFLYGKDWEWGAYAYIHREVAAQSPCVMHMVLAMGARELLLCSAENMSFSRHDSDALRRSAISHYNRAMSELSKLLPTSASVHGGQLDAAFTAFFLMICYESQFGNDFATIRTHLRGLLAFFNSACLLSAHKPAAPLIERVTPLGHQLLLIIATYDLLLVGLDPDAGTIFRLFLEHQESGQSFIDQLYSAAHLALPRLWGNQYPPDALLDDLENIKALGLIHECQKLRFQLWSISAETLEMASTSLLLPNLEKMLNNIKETYKDILLMASIAQGQPSRRVIRTILLATTEYYSAELFFHRTVCAGIGENQSRHGCHADSLPSLLLMAQKALAIDKRLLWRVSWPLLLASAETTDAIHAEWIRKYFDEAVARFGSLTGLERVVPISRTCFAAFSQVGAGRNQEC